jgi:glutamate formiminotransferase
MPSEVLLECVPNFSEGRRPEVIHRIAEAIRAVPGQQLLHTDPSPSANRTVFTFAGSPEAVVEAAFKAMETAAGAIDMRLQRGAHPRLGATDVCPLIPLKGLSMDEAVHWSKVLAEKVGSLLQIPVYLYEHSSDKDFRRSLPSIRKGEYEGLLSKMALPGWQPDAGPGPGNAASIARTGATIIGARNILVAFNVSLNTDDERIAADIARQIRSSNQGLLPAVRAIGWYMQDFGCAQVSMNLLNYELTSPLKAWETCRMLAAARGVEAVGCEVIGLIPEQCVLEAGYKAAYNKGYAGEPGADAYIQLGIAYMGLDKVKPFDPSEKILEFALRRAGLL